MVELVQLGREHGYDKLREAVSQALELGCTDAEAIRHLVESSVLRREQAQALGRCGARRAHEVRTFLARCWPLQRADRRGELVNAKSIELQSIRQHCKTLRMPSVATQFQKIAEQAQRDEHSYVRYLDVLLSAEVEEREHRAVQRRLKEAQLPRAKTLEEFDFSQSPKVSARRIRELAEGDYIDHARPVLFLGDAGTGKTHLATALCVAACQQRRRVRFTTASRLVNELVEAREEH